VHEHNTAGYACWCLPRHYVLCGCTDVELPALHLVNARRKSRGCVDCAAGAISGMREVTLFEACFAERAVLTVHNDVAQLA
jgi:hypothetical protein